MQGPRRAPENGAEALESAAGELRSRRKPAREGVAPPRAGSRRILGMRVDATSYAETADAVVDLVAAGAGGMVCAANVHMVMEAFDDPSLRRQVNAAERVTPDGVPLVWALRLLGVPGAEAPAEALWAW